MDPITSYKLSKIIQQEIEADFEQYGRMRRERPGQPHISPQRRLVLGLGSFFLNALIIVQRFTAILI
ncbi:MAG: hypothetical protein KJ077_21795 [Anaerolineae bacterium]|nr:hypothetical protein [Anaerolineae bacterium]